MKKDTFNEDGVNTSLPQSRLLGDGLHASTFSFNPDEKIDKDTLILMSLNQSKMMQNTSAEKFT